VNANLNPGSAAIKLTCRVDPGYGGCIAQRGYEALMAPRGGGLRAKKCRAQGPAKSNREVKVVQNKHPSLHDLK